ncbi:A-kinase anchor protein 7-like [Dendronephthya gigantea]|uniref:A-kinase anchor protein 7-like n=1 Tax=Dendronephthya gigantea TaxID=151771 RepID=UPI00106D8996|nr:A-kinase anchor protein 7-like [Dendronephthya gigantea]
MAASIGSGHKNESEDEDWNKVVKNKKRRPNHFVAIRVLDSKIHLAAKEFQETVLKENEKLKPALIPLISLHITMAVMHLDDPLIEIAKDSLEMCKEKINEALADVNFRLTFCGVGNFNNQVVFAKIQEKEQIECLKTINSVITETFQKNGICLSNKREYNPHLTLMKLSGMSSLGKSGIRKVEEKVYASSVDSYFGNEIVRNVYLCCMHGDKEDDGFYKCLSTITFSKA